jgi:hypothetical protein
MDGAVVSSELCLTLEGLVNTARLKAFEPAIVVEGPDHRI